MPENRASVIPGRSAGNRSLSLSKGNPGQEFANWIRNRIRDYGFDENQDFLINLSKSTGAKEYYGRLSGLGEINKQGRIIAPLHGRRVAFMHF